MDLGKLINVAADLSSQLTHALPTGSVVSYERPADGVVHLECTARGATWWLVLTLYEGNLLTAVVDGDGDAIKELFERPEDAAAFIINQFASVGA